MAKFHYFLHFHLKWELFSGFHISISSSHVLSFLCCIRNFTLKWAMFPYLPEQKHTKNMKRQEKQFYRALTYWIYTDKNIWNIELKANPSHFGPWLSTVGLKLIMHIPSVQCFQIPGCQLSVIPSQLADTTLCCQVTNRSQLANKPVFQPDNSNSDLLGARCPGCARFQKFL